MGNRITCASCNQKKNKYKSTFRNGQNLELCKECWGSALIVQRFLQVENKAEAARDRYLWKQKKVS